jgi:asparagine synthase (glutamine-hydrolysing)
MFAGAVRLDGGMPPLSFRAAVRGAPYCRDHPLRWVTTDGLIAVVGPEHGACPPAIVRCGPVTVVGMARIDNRAEALELLGDADPRTSDLALAGQMALRRGVAGVGRLLGDFAFVVWEADTRTLIAARDTFGVKQLYYAAPTPGVVTFSSRAELLAQGDDYNIEYLAAWVSYCTPDPSSTVYPRVAALPAASVLRYQHGLPRVVSYWSASDPLDHGTPLGSEGDQIDAVRSLLIDGVRSCLDSGARTWSELSGGLDSSSVVSTAQWLVRTGIIDGGLGGTVTFVDPAATAADERAYSDTVVNAYGIRNEKILHQIGREDVLADPPRLDQPSVSSYSIAARDRQVVQLVGAAGGSSLLTGIGGDNLFLGTMFFFADWVSDGHVVRAVREMAHRAALGRVSFWELAHRNVVLPLLPARLRRLVAPHRDLAMPLWVTPAIATRFGQHGRAGSEAAYNGRGTSRYVRSQVAAINAISSIVGDAVTGEEMDVRHPFLYRPLVELAVQLAPAMCVRPHARKWILREAMRGMLPEYVRERVGKGSGEGLASQSLKADQELTAHLLRDSMLEELGIIDSERLRAAATGADRGGIRDGSVSARVQATLDVELWLRVRSGRWGPDHTGGRARTATSLVADDHQFTHA